MGLKMDDVERMSETTIKERPILFSGEMVRAILDGRKTQTRRVIRPQPVYYRHDTEGWELARTENHRPVYRATFARLYCPYGAPGDRLWVRETWADCSTNPLMCEDTIAYNATEPEWDRDCEGIRWRPSIHMPRWASRITLEIADVRVERVQDITEADAEAEGVRGDGLGGNESMRVQFRWLWDKINASRGFGWDTNPWVWVVEFRRVEQ